MTFEAEIQLDKFLGFGLYQLLVFLVVQYSCLPSSLNMVFMTFGGYKPKWTCNDFLAANKTPTANCTIYADCSNLTFHSPFYSIIMEWDLNCGQKHIAYVITSIQMGGVAIGAIVFGHMSDLYGRRRTILLTEAGTILLGGLSALSPNWQVFCLFRFFIGLFLGGTQSTKFVYLTEFIGKKHRLWMNTVGGWPMMFVVFAGLAYTFPTWRKLSVVGNLLSLPVIFLFFLLEESPRWLIQHQRTAEAVKVLSKINRYNRRNLSVKDLELLNTENRTKQLKFKHHSFCYLFSKKTRAIQVSVLAISWFTVSTISYGILFNVDSVSGDPFFNMAFFGVVRLSVNISVAIVDTVFKKFGRKLLHFIPEFFIAISCITITVIIVTGNSEEFQSLTRILVLISGSINSCLWTVGYLMTAELISTSVRTLANSFCSFWARVAGVAVPQVLLLAHHWHAAPYVWFAALAILDMIAFQLIIPETKGRPLSEHHSTKGEAMETKTAPDPDGFHPENQST